MNAGIDVFKPKQYRDHLCFCVLTLQRKWALFREIKGAYSPVCRSMMDENESDDNPSTRSTSLLSMFHLIAPILPKAARLCEVCKHRCAEYSLSDTSPLCTCRGCNEQSTDQRGPGPRFLAFSHQQGVTRSSLDLGSHHNALD